MNHNIISPYHKIISERDWFAGIAGWERKREREREGWFVYIVKPGYDL